MDAGSGTRESLNAVEHNSEMAEETFGKRWERLRLEPGRLWEKVGLVQMRSTDRCLQVRRRLEG